MQAEKNYHPIELEMQSVTWGCEKMTPYLQGLPYFLVQTDHEPLVPILNYKPLIEMSPRIQDTRTRLLHFKFTAGKELKDADCLSRSPVDTPTKEDESFYEEILVHVNMVIRSMPATEDRIREIVKLTKEDPQLQELVGYITNGWPPTIKDCNAKEYWNMRNDLTF